MIAHVVEVVRGGYVPTIINNEDGPVAIKVLAPGTFGVILGGVILGRRGETAEIKVLAPNTIAVNWGGRTAVGWRTVDRIS